MGPHKKEPKSALALFGSQAPVPGGPSARVRFYYTILFSGGNAIRPLWASSPSSPGGPARRGTSSLHRLHQSTTPCALPPGSTRHSFPQQRGHSAQPS